eukprot:CAMPEP_0206218070 /NCGR_PEP_ID=MMETSP0047_2-20121206/3605_1 /ASSEMBLY_ACC=CAM_ASM_000192 /TAXON_ID=195065 /ORGANISM="Chroomonas mesostigmatica_cf, Strain CCMP1168" /LENGTH=99 /DNA_ID=CAMNT_0053640553 /DNA_START=112 /DNA_END=412 /DNA_ORIENTATION=-
MTLKKHKSRRTNEAIRALFRELVAGRRHPPSLVVVAEVPAPPHGAHGLVPDLKRYHRLVLAALLVLQPQLSRRLLPPLPALLLPRVVHPFPIRRLWADA